MVTMKHPNGCIHEVKDELVDKFKNAGWKIKAAPKEQPSSTAEPKKRKTTKSEK